MSEPTENPARQFQIDVLGRLSALQASIATTSETFTSQVSGLLSIQAGMTAEVADIRSLVEALKSDVAEIRPAQAEMTADVADIRSLVEALKSDLSEIRPAQAEMTADVADIKSLVEALKSDLSELDTFNKDALGSVKDALGSLKDALGSLKDALGLVTADQVRLRVEIMARIDRLQGTVDLVREDARVNWATADTAINRVKNNREEIDNLTAMISAMERRYQTLSSIKDGLRDVDAKKSNGS